MCGHGEHSNSSAPRCEAMLEREPGKRQDGAISSANGPQSLWNHSANPGASLGGATRSLDARAGSWIGDVSARAGWSAEEAQVFKLLLKKFGVGKFAQIQSCGLLQGKTASQLCKLAQVIACCVRGTDRATEPAASRDETQGPCAPPSSVSWDSSRSTASADYEWTWIECARTMTPGKECR